MYAKDTILARKEPFTEPVEGEVEGDPRSAYNRVRVVGPSPITYAGGAATWQGGDSAGVVIEPLTSFGGVIHKPLGELQADYDIEFEPVVEVSQATVRVIDSQSRAAGPTPEEVFADKAPKATGPDARAGRDTRRKATKP